MKITDFGLAKKETLNVTRGVGTPAYMAPELFDDEDDEKPAGDPKAFHIFAQKELSLLRKKRSVICFFFEYYDI